MALAAKALVGDSMTGARDVIELRVAGARYDDWLSARVTAGLTRAVRDFRLELPLPARLRDFGVKPFDACELRIGGELIVTGAVDGVALSMTATSRVVSVSGRSRTAQVVDCSVPPPWQGMLEVTVPELAALLAEPHGVDVVEKFLPTRRLGKIPEAALMPGETGFAAIERYARGAGIIVTDDEEGRLVTTGPVIGRPNSLLLTTEAKIGLDVRGLYHEYRVIGESPGTSGTSGTPAAAVAASALDERVPENRLKVIRAESGVDLARAQDRALWEATVRAGQALSVQVVTPSWRGGAQGAGLVWRPGDLVELDDDVVGLRGTMVVAEATWAAGGQGTTTTLSLVPEEALAVEGQAGGTPARSVDVSALWGSR